MLVPPVVTNVALGDQRGYAAVRRSPTHARLAVAAGRGRDTAGVRGDVGMGVVDVGCGMSEQEREFGRVVGMDQAENEIAVRGVEIAELRTELTKCKEERDVLAGLLRESSGHISNVPVELRERIDSALAVQSKEDHPHGS